MGLSSYFPASLYAPTASAALARANATKASGDSGFAAASVSEKFSHPAAGFMAASSQEYGIDYFLKGALAGGICCSVTHGALTPVDVVKTRMQLDPSKYTGMVSGFNKVIAEEGAGALLTGLGPTAFGYFVQGWFKFGGVEYFKIQAHNSMTPQQTWDNRNSIYLGASAAAEFIADIFLCPLEATRIRLVSNPTYASSMLGRHGQDGRRGGRHRRLLLRVRAHPREAGAVHHGQVRRAGAFYLTLVPVRPRRRGERRFLRTFCPGASLRPGSLGFNPRPRRLSTPLLTPFNLQGATAEKIYDSLGKTPKEMSSGENISVSLASGVVAGVTAAIISHPADTLLSKINKAGAGGSGGMFSRLANIAAETGLVKLCTQGLAARCVLYTGSHTTAFAW